jgi:hypothetical protein
MMRMLYVFPTCVRAAVVSYVFWVGLLLMIQTLCSTPHLTAVTVELVNKMPMPFLP